MADTYNQEVPADLKALCPDCVGVDSQSCPTCDGIGHISEQMLMSLHNYPDNPEHPALEKNAFSTASLLTRDFQKSEAYQNYIFEKGGPGSGAQPGHTFNGNNIGKRGIILDLKKDTRFRFILVFKNHGAAAGATLEHSHSQLIALPIVPDFVREELEGAKRHFEQKERCVFCDIVQIGRAHV